MNYSNRQLKCFRISKVRSLLFVALLALVLSDACITHTTKKKDEKKEDEKKEDEKKEDKSEKSESDKKEEESEKGEGKDEKKGDKDGKDGKEGKDGDDKDKKGGACNADLLANFRLDGLEKDEQGSQMIACGNVTAGNNCCSKVDEIKIVKSWNAFSVPKLDKFADDMIANYKRVYSFDSFVRELDAKKGRYHYSDYKWHKTAEEKCYDGKYFVSKTGIGKLHAKLDWNHMLAEKTANYILNYVMEKLETEGLLDRGDISTHIQKKLKGDKGIHKLLMDARPGFGMKHYVNSIEAHYIKHLETTAGTLIAVGTKKKEESLKAFLTRTLAIGGTLQTYMDKEYASKNIKDFQAYTVKLHINQIIIQLKHFITKVKKQPTGVLTGIHRHLNESGGIKKRLEYFVIPQNLKDNKIYTSVFNYVLKSVTDTVLKHKDVKGNNYSTLVEILKDIKRHLTRQIKNRLYYTFRNNTLPYIIYTSISNMCQTMSTNKQKRYSAGQLVSIIKKLNFKTLEKYSLSSHSKRSINFRGHRNNFAKRIRQAWNEAKKAAGIKTDDNQRHRRGRYAGRLVYDINKIIYPAFDKTYKDFNNEMKKIKPPMEQKALVCAVVYHSNLFREVRFNQEKLDYCMKAEAEFKAHKVPIAETVALIDSLRPQLRSILELKRGFYCSICDKASAAFIDVKKQQITLGKNFCYSVVTEHKKYLEWKNVAFMQYILKAYQYLKCFSDDGSPQKMPFAFMDPEHEAALPSMQSCLAMKSKKDVGHCLSLCDSFDYVHYSPAFDGERKFIHKMINFILGVVRTHGFQYKRILEADKPDSGIKRRNLSVQNLYGEEENEFGNFNDAYIDDDYWRSSRYLTDAKKADKKEEESEDDKKKEEEKKKDEKEVKKTEVPKTGEKKPVEDKDKKPTPKGVPTIYDILKNIGKATVYSRIKYHTFNEISHSHRTYNVTKPNIDFSKMTYIMADAGLDPVAIFKSSNFDPSVAHMLIGHTAGSHENLDRNVVRALVGIEDSDIVLFNTGIDNSVGEGIPEDAEQEKKEAQAEEVENQEKAKAEAAKPKVEAPKAEGAEGENGAKVTEGSGDKPRKLYGKLYRKLYKHKKHRRPSKSYHRHSSPLMKTMIDILF